MKIAIFSDTFLPQVNGVANVVYQSARSLSEAGHEVCIFTVTGRNGKSEPVCDLNEKMSVVVLPSMPAGAYANERFTLPVGAALRRLKKFSPDVIHTHTPFALGWEAIWGAKMLKKPLVGTHHTFYDHYLKHIKADFSWTKKFSWKYTVAFYNFCDLVLSPSESLADSLLRQGLKRPVQVLQNAIETEFFVPVPNEKTKKALKKRFGIKGSSVVYMGRISYEKNIDQAIKAFARAVKKNKNIEMVIVGDGPEKANLEKLAQELGLKNKLIFTGMQKGKDLVAALQANDAFITACKSENGPLSIMEAMSCGLPMISVDEKGLGEIIKDNQNGFLLKADDVEGMAEKILELFSEPELLKKFSLASRALAFKYSKENVRDLLQRAYERATILLKSKT